MCKIAQSAIIPRLAATTCWSSFVCPESYCYDVGATLHEGILTWALSFQLKGIGLWYFSYLCLMTWVLFYKRTYD